MKKIASEILLKENIIEIDNPEKFKWLDVYYFIQEQIQNKYLIKVNLVKSTRNKLYFNVVYLEGFNGFINESFMPNAASPLKGASSTNDISCLIIPTGIGALFGGYAGDANPLAKIFAHANKYLIANPNVVNGAVLSDLPDNLIYLEGFLLDHFLLGRINIVPNKQNIIGVIFDKGIDDERLEYEINVLNALRVFYGCNIKMWTQTKKPLVIRPKISNYGFSSGSIENLECLIDEALKLKNSGVTAIAVSCLIPDIEANSGYIYGKGVDPVGGIESIISHTVSSATGLVSAHAPVLAGDSIVDYKNISPLVASEYIAKTFLPSVISGLRFAPQIVVGVNLVGANQCVCPLSNIILPYNAFGSAGVFYQNEMFKNVILIKENSTCLDVKPEHLSIQFKVVDNYIDLTNLNTLKELGIDIDVLKRPLKSIPRLA